jgi:hypothetical protein
MYAVLEIIRYDHLVDKGVAKGGQVGPAHPRIKPKPLLKIRLYICNNLKKINKSAEMKR